MSESNNGWGSVSSASRTSGKKSIENLRLTGTQKVRFVGNFKKFYKYFLPGKSAITDAGDDCQVRKLYPDTKPSERYAINVIDREDGKLKILECALTVLRPVGDWGNITGKNPGGSDSVDFAITTTGKGTSTRYTVMALPNASVLTDKDREEIKAQGGTENGYDLEKLYKAVPQDQIIEKLFGRSPSSGNSANTTTSNVGQRVEIKKAVETVDQDIPF